MAKGLLSSMKIPEAFDTLSNSFEASSVSVWTNDSRTCIFIKIIRLNKMNANTFLQLNVPLIVPCCGY